MGKNPIDLFGRLIVFLVVLKKSPPVPRGTFLTQLFSSALLCSAAFAVIHF